MVEARTHTVFGKEDAEIDVLVARVVVVSPSNYLFSENCNFLRKLINALPLQFELQIPAGVVQKLVEDPLANMSAELYRRRAAMTE